MNIENLTLRQWWSMLTIKHLSYLIGMMVASCGVGYFFGGWNLDKTVLERSAELRSEIDDLKRDKSEMISALNDMKSKYAELLEINKSWSENAKYLKEQAEIQDSKIEYFQQREAQLNSCKFTQEQIESVTSDIENRKNEILNYPSKYEVVNQIYIAGLEKRLSGYLVSLQFCNSQRL